MKGLVDYIKEACEEKVPASKSFKFNLGGFEGADEIIKSAQEKIESDGIDGSVEDKTISISVKKEDAAKSKGLFDLIDSFLGQKASDTKNASDQAYAEKVAKLKEKVTEYNSYASAPACEEEPEKKDDKKEPEKKDDKKEEE